MPEIFAMVAGPARHHETSMHTCRTAVVALAATAALALGAPVATASSDPDPVLPGQPLTVSDDRNCDMANGARASSALFGDAIMSAGANHMFATAKVPSGTRPGTYAVTVECGVGGKTYSFAAHVSGMPVSAGAPAASASPAPARGAGSGFGGSIDGTDAAGVVIGAALLVVAGGVGAAVKRRRAGRKS
jgi:hypothetical protein